MVDRLDLSNFNSQFENFALLTPFARVAFLEVIHRVNDEDFGTYFASGTLSSLIDVCRSIISMHDSEERNYRYFQFLNELETRIREKRDQISIDCEVLRIDHSFDEQSIFQVSLSIAQYLLNEAKQTEGTELNDMCKYLENIRD